MIRVDAKEDRAAALTIAAARRLWDRSEADRAAPVPVTVVADRVYVGLRSELGRWIGVDGFHSLLDRSLAAARAEHPALSGLTHLGGEDPLITAAVKEHGSDAVSAGLVGVLAQLTELLGRIVGIEMAVHLMDQVGVPSARGFAGTESEDPLND